MTIAAGEAIPQASFQIKTEDGIATHDSLESVSYTHLTLPTMDSV